MKPLPALAGGVDAQEAIMRQGMWIADHCPKCVRRMDCRPAHPTR